MTDWWDEVVTSLVEDGSIEEIFTDSKGEQRIKFNMELLEILHPTHYRAAVEAQNEEIEETLSSLIDKGFVEMTFEVKDDGTLESLYGLTEAGREYVEAMNLTDQG